jgi:phosphate transport system permease protein
MNYRNKAAEGLFFWAALASCIATIAVLGFMGILSLPLVTKGFFPDLLTGSWAPYYGHFGILPMIAGSFYISFLSLVISLPLSFGCSIFITLTQPGIPGKTLKKLIELMTGIPTVIYGFVGIFLLVPFVRDVFAYGSGMCVLSASIMLGLVISPTMILFFIQSIDRVPKTYLNAVDALGGTVFQKLRHIVIPNAWPGIMTGIILAFGRAMGDTMIALMISGNSIGFPHNVLDSARTLTAHIALIIAADFDSIEFKIIFACGTCLYFLTGLAVILARIADKKHA